MNGNTRVNLVRRESDDRPLGSEFEWADRLSLRRLKRFSGLCSEPLKHIPLSIDTHLEYSCLILDPVCYVGPDWTSGPLKVLEKRKDIDLVVPVSNEAAVVEQRAAPPFCYHTPHLLDLACVAFRKTNEGAYLVHQRFDPFIVVCRTAWLKQALGKYGLKGLKKSVAEGAFKGAVALDTYVHRYGAMYDQARPDLLSRVPPGIIKAMDVGCAKGVFGAELKKKGCPEVLGIEKDPVLAKIARERLDRVLENDLEELREDEIPGDLDLIVCGDLLEHLVDPHRQVRRFLGWLKPGGTLLFSVPNVGHWSVVMDLIAGRWDYSPFSTLSGTHLRFFTRTGIMEMLVESNYTINRMEPVIPETGPPGTEFMERLGKAGLELDLDSLKAVEYIVSASKLK